MTDAERIEKLKPYLRHHSDCAFINGGRRCDCGLYRLLHIEEEDDEREKNGSAGND